MKRMNKLALALALVALPAAPALAGWKLVAPGKSAAVAKSTLAVTPGEAWNRGSARPIKKSEVWTLDGVVLNELYFVSGLIGGETMLRDAAKKDRPLPKFAATMQLTDIPEFVESSYRTAFGTSMFKITNVEPAKLGGHDAVRFAYEYAVEGSKITRKGLATGTVVNKQFYLISFTAPATFYFDRDRARVTAIMDSAKL